MPRQVVEAWSAIPFNDDRMTAALTRWHAELVAAETQRKAPDDTAPERLRERREALGLSREDVAVSSGIPLWYGIGLVEEYTGQDDVRARYAAALTAEERRRAQGAKPAPEVVDVPQPEPWHARLVRLAQEAQDASRACADAEAAFTKADAERETARKARAAAREACHVKRQALTAATTAAAIVEAAQQTAPAPTRPEPRYKVGDWVRVTVGGTVRPTRGIVYQIAEIEDVFGTLYYREKSGAATGGESWAATVLTPALDPALHETAPATEVVDVPQEPQPIVKRCGEVGARWDRGDTLRIYDNGDRPTQLDAPLLLLRAMLAAIDAQQGGAS